MTTWEKLNLKKMNKIKRQNNRIKEKTAFYIQIADILYT